MRTIPPESGFFLLLVTGVVLFTLPSFPSPYGLICLILAVIPGATLFLARQWPDRAFYLICAGQPAVIACGSTNIWAGLFVGGMLAGMVAGTLRLLSSQEDYRYLFLFYGLALVLALIVQVSSHVFFLCVAAGAGLALLAGIMTIRGYQFRKEYTGVRP